jgi:predicted DNA-binding protein
MPTTIQISDETKQMLLSLQKKPNTTYDQIIKELLTHHLRTPKSLYGSISKSTWMKKDRMTFYGE